MQERQRILKLKRDKQANELENGSINNGSPLGGFLLNAQKNNYYYPYKTKFVFPRLVEEAEIEEEQKDIE